MCVVYYLECHSRGLGSCCYVPRWTFVQRHWGGVNVGTGASVSVWDCSRWSAWSDGCKPWPSDCVRTCKRITFFYHLSSLGFKTNLCENRPSRLGQVTAVTFLKTKPSNGGSSFLLKQFGLFFYYSACHGSPNPHDGLWREATMKTRWPCWKNYVIIRQRVSRCMRNLLKCHSKWPSTKECRKRLEGFRCSLSHHTENAFFLAAWRNSFASQQVY